MSASRSVTLSSRRRAGECAYHSGLGRSDLCKVDADENAILKYVKLSEQGKRVSARTAKIPAWVELGNEADCPS